MTQRKEDHAINILATIYLKSQGSIRKALANKKRKGESEVIKDKAGNELSPQAAIKLTMITYLNRHLKENDKNLLKNKRLMQVLLFVIFMMVVIIIVMSYLIQ